MFKLGEKVKSKALGIGRIIKTDHRDSYPILVKFKNQKASFTSKGLYDNEQSDIEWDLQKINKLKELIEKEMSKDG